MNGAYRKAKRCRNEKISDFFHMNETGNDAGEFDGRAPKSIPMIDENP
jgi:hypothetical protein